MQILVFIIALSSMLASCSINQREYRRRNIELYKSSTTVLDYFLPSIPVWANFSFYGQCRRSEQIKYVNLEKLASSFHLTYEQGIYFQQMYNHMLNEATSGKVDLAALSPNFESELFYVALEKVRSGRRVSILPTYETVSIVLIDPLNFEESNSLQKRQSEQKLLSLMDSKKFSLGHPVFLSFCKTYNQVEEMIDKLNLSGRNIRIISMEMFNIQDENFKNQYNLTISLTNFFKPNQKINIFQIKKIKPDLPLGGNISIEEFNN